MRFEMRLEVCVPYPSVFPMRLQQEAAHALLVFCNLVSPPNAARFSNIPVPSVSHRSKCEPLKARSTLGIVGKGFRVVRWFPELLRAGAVSGGRQCPALLPRAIYV